MLSHNYRKHNYSLMGSYFLRGNVCGANRNLMKTRANRGKKSSKFTKKITHVDDMMIHNLIKYLIQTHCVCEI